jgi:hypothetical protein
MAELGKADRHFADGSFAAGGRLGAAGRRRRAALGVLAVSVPGLLALIATVLPVGSAAAGDAPRAGAEAAPDGEVPAHLGVEVAAQPATVAIADQLTVTVTYRWPHGWTVETPNHEPDPAPAFAHEFVTSFPPALSSTTGEEERRTFRLSVMANHSGSWELPRPTLAVRGPAGRRDLIAAPVIVQVGTEARPAELPPPRPQWVRPLTDDGARARPWLWLAAVLAAGALTVLALWRRRAAAAAPTPFAVLLDDLRAATATGDGKEAGARLSLALRRYVGSQFSFDGPGSTTRETAAVLRGRLPEDEHRALLRLLDQLDGLRWSPGELAISALMPPAEAARSWCDQLQRRLDAEAAERAAAGRQSTDAQSSPRRPAA